jgi:sortase family protein
MTAPNQRRTAVAVPFVLTLALLTACAPHPTWPPPGLGASTAAPATHSVQPVGQPTRIQIPEIALDWPVVPVGLDADGAMAAPQGGPDSPVWREGFWWPGGYRVGEAGNAVIAGHVDDPSGALTQFARIAELQPGASVLVTLDGGSSARFRVRRVARVPVPVGGPNDPTLQEVFGPASTPRLNLITCAGTWMSGGFDERLVVFTTLG